MPVAISGPGLECSISRMVPVETKFGVRVDSSTALDHLHYVSYLTEVEKEGNLSNI